VLVTAREIRNNRIRVYYSLTDKGHSVAREKVKEMIEFIKSLQLIIEIKPGVNYA